jgi:hypothetical protein
MFIKPRSIVSIFGILLLWSSFSLVASSSILHRAEPRKLSPRQSEENDVAKPPRWIDHYTLEIPPPCAYNTTSCWWTTARLEQCSVLKCTGSLCRAKEKFVDMTCLCGTLGSQGCASSCSTPILQAGYHHWLNLTCGRVPQWQGLPADWLSKAPQLDTAKIGPGDKPSSFNPSTCKLANEENIEPQYDLPSCVKESCVLYDQAWRSSLYSGVDVVWANLSIPKPYLSPLLGPCGLHVNRPGVCGPIRETVKDICPSICQSTLGQAQYLLWLNNTCSGSSSFQEVPANWQSIVDAGVVNSEYDRNDTDLAVPDCANGACGAMFVRRAIAASDTFCVLDRTATYCQTNQTRISSASFCSNISYASTCPEYCTRSHERAELLRFMNSTCSATADWSGLPLNWTNLLEVQYSDLKPWGNLISTNTKFSSYNANVSCPTAETNLAVFGIVNGIMLLATPILGRRQVVAWITRGLLGKEHSSSWAYMGPVMALIQLAANAANAAAIKATPGYSEVDIKTLLLLWTARPRVAWLVVFLIPYGADQTMYQNCAATSLVAEFLLQLISSYSFGIVANYGRAEGFYTNGDRLQHLPSAPAARMMYAGALLWLVVISFCLLLVAYSVYRVQRGRSKMVSPSKLCTKNKTLRLT